MKVNLTLLLFLIFCTSFGQTVEKITIPKGVVYNYAKSELVEKAKQLIEDDLKDDSNYALSGKIMIIGPVLWNRFKNIKKLNEIEGGNTTFLVDNDKLSGKMTQDVEDTKKVWDELRKEIGKDNYSIRKANERELRYYWSVISFDIDEPLLILETKKHSYILNILKDDLKVMWLDEVPRR